jgi:hypothetical protein
MVKMLLDFLNLIMIDEKNIYSLIILRGEIELDTYIK